MSWWAIKNPCRRWILLKMLLIVYWSKINKLVIFCLFLHCTCNKLGWSLEFYWRQFIFVLLQLLSSCVLSTAKCTNTLPLVFTLLSPVLQVDLKCAVIWEHLVFTQWCLWDHIKMKRNHFVFKGKRFLMSTVSHTLLCLTSVLIRVGECKFCISWGKKSWYFFLLTLQL